MELKKFASFAGLFLLPALGYSLDFQPVVDLDLRGGYANVVGSTSSGLGLGNLFVVPALSLSDSTLLLPNIYANASGQERSIEEDTVFVRTLLYGFKPVLKYKYSSSTTLLARVDIKHNYDIQALGESFGTGLYDYEEYGGGVGADFATLLPVPFSLGLDYSHRSYPNYRNQNPTNPVLAAALGSKDYYFKDFWDLKPSLKADLGPIGRFDLALQVRSYPDSYLYAQDLTIPVNPGTLQRDYLVTADLKGGMALTKEWMLLWSFSEMDNSSNMGSVDTTANRFFADSESYSAFTVSPGLQWQGELWGASLAYSAVFRNLNRPIQNSDGSYADGMIADIEHGINAEIRRKLAYHISAVLGGSYRLVRSNQEATTAGLPNYAFYNINAGLQWQWQKQ
jgi:hypothetical protein